MTAQGSLRSVPDADDAVALVRDVIRVLSDVADGRAVGGRGAVSKGTLGAALGTCVSAARRSAEACLACSATTTEDKCLRTVLSGIRSDAFGPGRSADLANEDFIGVDCIVEAAKVSALVAQRTG